MNIIESDSMSQKIEEAKRDEDIVKIMAKAASAFYNQLSDDEIENCKLNALWKAFSNHDKGKAAKFTTYLYNGVRIECIRTVKFNQKSKLCNQKLHANTPERRDHFLMTDLMDEINKFSEKELILDRMKNMTISEIAKKHGYNRETARRKINKMSELLRKKVLK